MNVSLSLIPQVFYDLIARVIPGVVVIVTWYLAVSGPENTINSIITHSSKQNLFNFWSFALLFLPSYILGIILTELWSLTFEKVKKKARTGKKKKYWAESIAEYNQVRKCFGKPELEIANTDLPYRHVMHDQIRVWSPAEGYRLLKLQAEIRLCETLFMGLFLLPVVNVIFWFGDGKLLVLDRALLELAVIAATTALWKASNRFEKFYTKGTCFAWLSFSYPVGPQRQTQDKSPNTEK